MEQNQGRFNINPSSLQFNRKYLWTRWCNLTERTRKKTRIFFFDSPIDETRSDTFYGFQKFSSVSAIQWHSRTCTLDKSLHPSFRRDMRLIVNQL